MFFVSVDKLFFFVEALNCLIVEAFGRTRCVPTFALSNSLATCYLLLASCYYIINYHFFSTLDSRPLRLSILLRRHFSGRANPNH